MREVKQVQNKVTEVPAIFDDVNVIIRVSTKQFSTRARSNGTLDIKSLSGWINYPLVSSNSTGSLVPSFSTACATFSTGTHSSKPEYRTCVATMNICDET